VLFSLLTIYRTLLDWIFPPKADIAAIERLNPDQFKHLVSKAETADLPSWVTSLFKYKDPVVRTALWALKYEGNPHSATLFGVVLAERINSLVQSQSILIPLPSSRERRRERGWNQAELIAFEVMKHCPQCTLNTKALIKIKHTVSQTTLSRSRRLDGDVSEWSNVALC
jgi:predicted amidophosphoribosyltransferase